MANPLRVNTAELLRRAGTERAVDVTVTPVELLLVDERLDPDSAVTVALHLESLTDGVVIRGTVEADWHGLCRRCAAPTEGHLVCDVNELYQEVLSDPEAFQLEGNQLDLAPMIREVIMLDAPGSPLCRLDCRGLCPHCGIDLNTGECSCNVVYTDPRWAALEQFE